ncbi:MAG: hypothetical protein IPJ81_16205 [Chitinophagaceae bacterium]|nr:hypothetical protein [Chitinophagaceae bacterium]
MSNEKIAVWEALANIGIKLLLAISSIIAFFIILYHIITAKAPLQGWTLTALDSMLSFTNYKIISHYFHAIKAVGRPIKKNKT